MVASGSPDTEVGQDGVILLQINPVWAVPCSCVLKNAERYLQIYTIAVTYDPNLLVFLMKNV